MRRSGHRDPTLVTHAGRAPRDNKGFVNPPVYHASTVLFPSMAALRRCEADPFNTAENGYNYGRLGTPTSEALEEAVTALERAHGTISVSSGLAAISTALLAILKVGDHLLVTDSAYFPTRKFCDGPLRRFGVETTYYPPEIGADIADLIRPNTRAIFLEAPGSLTFEMQDVPGMAETADAHGVLTLIDNTWATPLFFKPLTRGVDISIHAATKYIVGHADAMLGTISCRTPETWRKVKVTAVQLGQCAGPDDLYLGIRGLRSMTARLQRHQEAGLAIARWLQQRPEVDRVLHPALPDDPGHAIWKRDFSGACGLFSFVLRPVPEIALDAFVDNLSLFGLGASWGGYESLVLPGNPNSFRTATRFEGPGPLVRLHIGLEDPADLMSDLDAGFGHMARAVADAAE